MRGKSHNDPKPIQICCLCGKRYTEYGNNAAPLSMGRCCDDCNTMKVIPERIHRAHGGGLKTK